MSRILKFIFLFAGLGLLIWAMQSVDTTRVFELLLDMGYGFNLILLVFALVTYIDTIAWQYNFHPEQVSRFSSLQLWRIRQIGETYNAITPLGTMGGEPVKAQLLKEHHGLTFKQGLSSLVITKTTMLTGLITFFIPGIILIYQSEIVSAEFKYISLIGMVVFTILIFLFFLFQVTGMLGVLASWADRVIPALTGHAFLDQLKTLDGLMSAFYREFPDRTIKSIFYAFVGWVVGLGELYFTLYFLGYDPTFAGVVDHRSVDPTDKGRIILYSHESGRSGRRAGRCFYRPGPDRRPRVSRFLCAPNKRTRLGLGRPSAWLGAWLSNPPKPRKADTHLPPGEAFFLTTKKFD